MQKNSLRINQPCDKKLFAEILKMYYDDVPKDQLLQYLPIL